ncbi:DUF6934 family protein [Dyadobacter alkalitolerans]|uniref:DUF6934 family protein n=1 Tax=Dyadobacter alkalitolerans TaxID=492736 RepID=UPI000479C31F|nr:hypothetical protein [Dyadobacter alkalitolerans]
MKTEHYDYKASENCLLFEFESVSEFKSIRKLIIYTPSEKVSNMYNLALCDILSNGESCDRNISNNLDMGKVIATVVKSMVTFCKAYPNSSIYITGSTPARTRLYNIIISKELSEARRIFEIYGLKETKRELFISNREYDAFLITYLNDKIR